ncbi:hypothetical protein GCM10020258_24130 [Sphingomonas yabuuchiae]
MNRNLTEDRPTFVTHLECSLTGERYEADQLHGLSRAGRPLLVRYDLEALGQAVSRDTIAARETDLWRWRELLPVRRTGSIVSLGEIETPLIPIPRSGGASVLVKDEGGCRPGRSRRAGWSWRWRWRANWASPGSQCRPTAMRARPWPPMPRAAGSRR